MSTERPILFSGPMIRAILEDRKTVTRRVISPPPYQVHGSDLWFIKRRDLAFGLPDGTELCTQALALWSVCPYGKSGTHLWVRESFRLAWTPCKGHGIEYLADESYRWQDAGEITIPFGDWDKLYRLPPPHYCDNNPPRKKRPGIFMPRWASRIDLEVCSVSVERLQDISLEDARAEGIPQTYGEALPLGLATQSEPGYEWDNRTSVENFARLWNSINGKRAGCDWSANPHVWRVEFRRLEQ